MEKEYVDKYYMTEIDVFKDSIYCHHALMGDSYIVEHNHIKGQFLYTEGGVVFLKTADKSYFLPARHYIWIPSGVRHSIHPSSPHVIMRNLYFPRFETDTAFFDKINIYPVNDLLIELIMFTNRWNGNIFPSNEPNYSIAKAFKLLLPELSQSELPLALPYPQHPKLKNIVDYLEKNIKENIGSKLLADKFDISERSLARLFQKE
ncbi:AraC family transcriptional regulator, partial [Parapusillimonas sp. SGNA-6]|nr:AraC family transcriptional regulator [Parapusillimonas sp. SGNA-6]